MNINYKIVEVWPEDHLIVVRYFTDIVTEEDLRADPNDKEDGTPYRCRTDVSIDVPIPEPDEVELDKIILRNAPKAFLEKMEKVKDTKVNTKMTKTKKLAGKVKVATEEDYKNVLKSENSRQALSVDEIKALLNKIN